MNNKKLNNKRRGGREKIEGNKMMKNLKNLKKSNGSRPFHSRTPIKLHTSFQQSFITCSTSLFKKSKDWKESCTNKMEQM